METFALSLASAAFFTLGCAILQTFRQHADLITPVLMWVAMMLFVTILTVAAVQYQIEHGADAFLLDPANFAML